MICSLVEHYIEGEVELTSIKVSVLNKDNKYGGRNVNIQVNSTSFSTPTRSATNRDYSAASALPHKVTITNPIAEFISDFNSTSLGAFVSRNGSFQRRRQRIIEQFLDMMRYFPRISSIQFPQNTKVTYDQLMLFQAFQNHPSIDIVSIPPFEYDTISDYRRTIEQYAEIAISRKQEAMPIIPLSSDPVVFKEEFSILRELHSNGLCNVIGFQYADPFRYPIQYLEIFKNRECDLWYHCFGVPRTPRGRNTTPVAHIHEIQNWGLDTYSPVARDLGRKQIVYLIMQSKAKKESDLYIQRYDAPVLGIIKEDQWLTRYGHELHCVCPVCKGRDLSSFKQDFTHELNGDFNPNLLRSADKVHELVSGSSEFNSSAEAIKNDDLTTYFSGKEFTRNRVRPPDTD